MKINKNNKIAKNIDVEITEENLVETSKYLTIPNFFKGLTSSLDVT